MNSPSAATCSGSGSSPRDGGLLRDPCCDPCRRGRGRGSWTCPCACPGPGRPFGTDGPCPCPCPCLCRGPCLCLCLCLCLCPCLCRGLCPVVRGAGPELLLEVAKVVVNLPFLVLPASSLRLPPLVLVVNLLVTAAPPSRFSLALPSFGAPHSLHFARRAQFTLKQLEHVQSSGPKIPLGLSFLPTPPAPAPAGLAAPHRLHWPR